MRAVTKPDAGADTKSRGQKSPPPLEGTLVRGQEQGGPDPAHLQACTPVHVGPPPGRRASLCADAGTMWKLPAGGSEPGPLCPGRSRLWVFRARLCLSAALPENQSGKFWVGKGQRPTSPLTPHPQRDRWGLILQGPGWGDRSPTAPARHHPRRGHAHPPLAWAHRGPGPPP